MAIVDLTFGGGVFVLGLVLVGTFVKVYLDYQRKWREAPPAPRRRRQVTRTTLAGTAAAIGLAVLGLLIVFGAPRNIFGWAALVLAVVGYAMLYPLSDERRFIGGANDLD